MPGMRPIALGYNERIAEVQRVLRSVFRRTSRPVPSPQFGWMNSLAKATLDAAKTISTDGSNTPLWYPDGSGSYQRLWIRDVALAMEGMPGYFSPSDIKAVYDFIKARVNTGTYEVPDRITPDGTAEWGPFLDQVSGAPLDGVPFLISIAWTHYATTGLPAIYSSDREFLWSLVERGIPFGSSGCVTISDSAPRVGFGFEDTVKITGDALTISVLVFRALLHLADMAHAARDAARAKYALDVAEWVRYGVEGTLWDETVGLYRASTGKCSGQHDLWGNALAVWCNLPSADRTARIASWFDSNHDSPVNNYHVMGGIRHVAKSDEFNPGVQVWEAVYSPVSYGTYQQGGYWPISAPWVAYCVGLVNLSRSAKIMRDLISMLRRVGGSRAPEYWTENLTLSTPVKYVDSVAVPMLMLGEESTAQSRVSRFTIPPQSVPSGVHTTLALSASDDPYGFWNSGQPTRITIPSDMRVRVLASLAWAVNDTGVRFITLAINGTEAPSGKGISAARRPASGYSETMLITGPMDLAAGSYITVVAEQTSGANLDTLAATTSFVMVEVLD